MPIYKTGTIAITTGGVATGTGTAWTTALNGLRVGQTILVNTNPQQQFTISAINSATSLRVTPSPAAAISTSTYAILITDALTVDGLGSMVSEAVQYFKTSLSGRAASGANTDITSLSNLQTALSVAQGGTGSKDSAKALETLGGVSRTGDQIIEGLKTFASRLTAPFYHSSAGYPGLTLISTDIAEATIGRTVVIEHHGSGLYVTRRKGNGSDNTNQILNSFPAGGGVLALASSSDERIKTKDGLTPAGALSRLAQLEVHDFHYKHVEPYVQEYQSERPRRGFMAQQVYSVDETYANKPTSNLDNLNPAGGEVWEINEHALIADLVLAVRELRTELEELKTTQAKM